MSRVAKKLSDIEVGQLVVWSGSDKNEIVAGAVQEVSASEFNVRNDGSGQTWSGFPLEIEDGEWTIFKEAPLKPVTLSSTARVNLEHLKDMLATENGNRDCGAVYTRGDWEVAVGRFINSVEGV